MESSATDAQVLEGSVAGGFAAGARTEVDLAGIGATKRRAIVFVTDEGFLVPSLVAAEQVAQQEKVVDIADIFIITIDFLPQALEDLRAEWAGVPINFISLESKFFLPGKDKFFNPTHVPRNALGRLALHEVIPPNYENIVYLDGDVLVVDDISPLVLHDVQPGYILASNDYLWLCQNDLGKFWPKHRDYLDGIGIVNPVDYFNSGVLAFRLDTWRDMAPEALEYFSKNDTRAMYHDQSILNAVFRNRRELLSPRYNFITNFADYGFVRELCPAIIHFTGGGKPWFYKGPPWNGRFTSVYEEFFARHPSMRARLRTPSREAVARSERIFRWRKLKARLMMPWRQPVRRRRFRSYLDGTSFAVGHE